ncbi:MULTISPECIES: carbohydrate-binding protein [unclassified Burkholderia]|uniref:carbohydrate-binding protein n=1 Tax=unclassified Burkholderia TaxID=2613784 RepID=UPI000F561EA0|nr:MULTISPECIES: carbohydrate-binding protein [unclassified Burkholderia]RQR87743.1 hypothetical protein DIE10_06565 [Burkholderia sp. Bp9011]RQR97086.1 hypothetical protein DIE09_06740 [Burkholderia sp. Bp9010]
MTILIASTPGPQGPPGLNWRGAWSSTATYAQGDGVTYNGTAYIALSASQNVVPGTAPLQWSVLTQLTFPNFASFAALQIPATSMMVFVAADETKGGGPILYFYDATGKRYWVAAVLDQ